MFRKNSTIWTVKKKFLSKKLSIKSTSFIERAIEVSNAFLTKKEKLLTGLNRAFLKMSMATCIPVISSYCPCQIRSIVLNLR